jgi:hypothetical protein
MATIRKLRGRWQAQVRRRGMKPRCKVLLYRVYPTGPKFRVLVDYLCCKHGRADVLWLQEQTRLLRRCA